VSAPAGRPLSLARVKALPAGAVVVDRRGARWRRVLSPSTGRPGWFYRVGVGSASPTSLWTENRPLQLVDAGEVTP